MSTQVLRPAGPFGPFTTDRLLLRRFTTADLAPFADLNADAEVMRYVGGTLTRAESDAAAERVDAHWDRWGYGWLAAELLDEHRMIGFVGIAHHRALPDDVEIGWRLARDVWGRGLATEGATVVRDAAFASLDLPRLVSITTDENLASRRVMDKLGFGYLMHLPFEQWMLRVTEQVSPSR